MFSDPQSVTVNAVAQSLPRISAEGMVSMYRKDDQSYQLIISHAEGKRNRRSIRLNHRKIAADPLTADNTEYSCSVYIVIDAPTVGYTSTELRNIALGLTGWASSGNLDKVLTGEN